MATAVRRALSKADYARYAREYARRLPLEHYMEARAQGLQRAIALASLTLLAARMPEMHVFNEMLVQYPRPRRRRPGQVVPDNMVVLYAGAIEVDGSYDVPFQPAPPFWVLEWVSKRSKGKDYEDSFKKYERELKVPYCLMFWPKKQTLDLFYHDGRRYVRVEASAAGRFAIPRLDLEVGLLDGWVRFWHQGELLPLPAELDAKLARAERRAEQEKRRADEQTRRADRLQQQVESLQRELERLRSRKEKS